MVLNICCPTGIYENRGFFTENHPILCDVCNFISISIEETGAAVELSEKVNLGGPYLIIQRTYPEAAFEKDSRYIETSDPDRSGFYENVTINLYRTKLCAAFNNESIEVLLDTNKTDFKQLKKALQIITQESWCLIIHDDI